MIRPDENATTNNGYVHPSPIVTTTTHRSSVVTSSFILRNNHHHTNKNSTSKKKSCCYLIDSDRRSLTPPIIVSHISHNNTSNNNITTINCDPLRRASSISSPAATEGGNSGGLTELLGAVASKPSAPLSARSRPSSGATTILMPEAAHNADDNAGKFAYIGYRNDNGGNIGRKISPTVSPTTFKFRNHRLKRPKSPQLSKFIGNVCCELDVFYNTNSATPRLKPEVAAFSNNQFIKTV